MKIVHAFRSVIGVLALALGIYLIIVNSLFIGTVALLFGGFMSVTGFTTPSGRQISGKINNLVYTSLRERGIERIRKGTFHVSEPDFLSSLEKIKDMFGKQAEMPELGYDSLFIHCQSEAEADRNLSYIRSAGLNASVIQNKRDWQIRIDFPDTTAK